MEKTTAQLLADLGRLRNRSGESAYKRITIAAKVFADKEWIATSHTGDAYAAAEYLQNEYFGDMCGAVSFLKLLEVYTRFPALDDWRANKFNVTLMYAKLEGERAVDTGKEKRSYDRPTKADRDQWEAEKKDLEFTVKYQSKDLKDHTEENVKLRQRVLELERENAELRGRLSELERIMDRQLAAA